MHADPHLVRRIMEVQIGFDCRALHLSTAPDTASPEFIHILSERFSEFCLYPPSSSSALDNSWRESSSFPAGLTMSGADLYLKGTGGGKFGVKLHISLGFVFVYTLSDAQSECSLPFGCPPGRRDLSQPLLSFSDTGIRHPLFLCKGLFVSSQNLSDFCLRLSLTRLFGLLKHHYVNRVNFTVSYFDSYK